MSGSYDVRSYLQGHYDDNVYFNNPVDYLSNLNDDYYLPLLQKADKILILSGQGNYKAPERSRACQTYSTPKEFLIRWISGVKTSITTGRGGGRCFRRRWQDALMGRREPFVIGRLTFFIFHLGRMS